MGIQVIIALAIFFIVYVIMTTEIFNKTVAVLLGGSLFIILGIVSQEKAFEEIDWNVIFLLIGMMIIVGITKRTGLFQYVAIKAAKAVKGDPIKILLMLSVITAVFSAFLDNVTTVLILTPVSILIAVELGVSPIPFVICEAIASNIGGTATLIGDPPNIMIGSAANLSFMDFLVNLGPVIIVILALFLIIIYFIFRKKLVVSSEKKARIMDFDESRSIEDKTLLIKSLIILGMVIVGFLLHSLLHLEAATIALAGASLLMILAGKEEVEKFFHEVEWGTIFFFIGLFILVGGLVEMGLIKKLAEFLLSLTGGDIKVTSIVMIWFSGFFSAFVDNIPYVATMIPLIQDMTSQISQNLNIPLAEAAVKVLPLWWSLSLGACLGGNGTLIGASANVVSAGLAGKSGYKISFLEFTKYGFFIMLITLAISTGYVILFLLK